MDAALQALVDRQEIVDTVVRWAYALDTKDWATARSCFSDQVETDYSDLPGVGPSRLTAEEFVDLRRRAHQKLLTQHLSTNHLVTLDGDHATCVSATLIHRLAPDRQSDNTFDTLAHYTHTLTRTAAGWRISRIKQSVVWNRGNASIHTGDQPGLP